MKPLYIFVVACFLASQMNVKAQDSLVQKDEPFNKFKISGYLEAYYSYDFNQPEYGDRPSFIYNFNRQNEININLGYIKAGYTDQRVRANLALAAGTYMNTNYVAEPGTLKNLLEANVGYKIAKNHNLWMDIGILPSHIGFESAVGKDNWTLTRSLVAENSPYFESGIKIGYTTKNEKLSISAMALNGWQRIKRLDGNSLISWGTQINYKVSDRLLLNYSTFAGTDKPDSMRLWRFYHNLYAIMQLNDFVGLTVGLDNGNQQNPQNKSDYQNWYSPVIIVRVVPHSKFAIAVRGEYFKDKNGVIISTATPNGFDTFGASANIDYSPIANLLFRLEGRYLQSRDNIFSKETTALNNNTALSFSTSFAF